MTVPVQKPGRSEQTVCTPPEFLRAVRYFLGLCGEFDFDLAASDDNAVTHPRYEGDRPYYTEQDNALVQTWKCGTGWNWCNPPFGKLAPWV
jgi:hypothetical protein